MTVKQDGITLVDDQSGGGAGGTSDVNVVSVSGSAITKGQKTSAESLPVVIASDQSPVPVSGTVGVTEPVTVDAVDLDTRDLAFATDKVDASGSIVDASGSIVAVASSALPTGAATEAKQDTGNTSLASVLTQLTSILAQLDVALSTRLAESTFTSRVGTIGQKTMAGSTPVVLPSDQSAIPVTLGALADIPVLGTIAHDAVDSGNPVKIGLKAESSLKGITLVADGDRTDAYGDLDGVQINKLNTSFADIISERISNTNGTSTAFANFTAVAGTKNYVTSIVVYNSSATAGFVDFRSGIGGAILWTMPLPAGGGAVISSAVPLFATAANAALAYDVSAALTTVYISVSGFQSKV